ncbi:Uncharacterised protein [Legionella wadsworthii]|uniref:Uncharacterized protein n=1 Tax=Legionella wadsworthii TaxID=28088 RepID=A0A378LYM6_9GAMM|nr:DUF5985 family protein [Legionella wadsworthii]STY29171.1 Uncharacterised protein [Legionella wadsworthii]
MINAMLIGAFAMASIIICLFFLRFWKSTQDSFFLYFAGSFLLEGLNRVILGLTTQQDQKPLIYIIRMCAYLLIVYAIFQKNKQYRKSMNQKVN